MKKRVLVAGLSHETHTFLETTTELEAFNILRGEAMLDSEGDASILAGILEVGRACGWEILPVVEMEATPGGIVSDAVVACFWEAFQEVVLRESPTGIDGVILNMHGAMVSQSFLDVEGEILCRVRGLPGLEHTPICGPLDLHGNITPRMTKHANGLIGYQENPHTDVKETGAKAARLLDRLMKTGERAQMVYEHPPIVWPPTGTGTADEPMRSLETQARKIEAENPEILSVSVFGGFSFADIPETGVSFTAVTVGCPEETRQKLQPLNEIALSLREQGNRAGIPLEEAMRQLNTMQGGLTALVEPADNIGGGGPGDLTHVLKAFVEHNIQNAAVCIQDPETVAQLWDTPPGIKREAIIGGKSKAIGAYPVSLEVVIVSQSDGSYQLEDPHSHAAGSGLRQEMGRCIVVRAGGVLILLTSLRTPPFDLGQWRSQGVAPESLTAIGVKAAVAHRQAYNPIISASYTLDTAGPCAENLQRLPYQNIHRPIYPLDAL